MIQFIQTKLFFLKECDDLKDELAELATQLEVKCSEVQNYKLNFERMQSDMAERTSEIENLNSQLHKAKQDSNNAVEKLKKVEDDLAQIKEKNAQLSDELLNRSRHITAIENSSGSGIHIATFVLIN